MDLAAVTKDVFDAQVGSRFTVRVAADHAFEVELVETRAVSTPLNAPRASFGLTFRSNERSHVPQRIYRLEHPVLGALDVFMVPLGPDAIGMRYDAVFS